MKGFPTSGTWSTEAFDRHKHRRELRIAMDGKSTIISWQDFFKEFVPEPAEEVKPKNLSTVFFPLSKTKNEVSMYTPLLAALNGRADLCPGYTFLCSSSKGDDTCDSKQAVDCGMYRESKAPPIETDEHGNTSPRATDWSNIEVSIECKSGTDKDPFDDTEPDGQVLSELRKETLGQILGYLQFIFDRQQRMFLFMVLILGSYARVVRVDRSGIFVTKRLNYLTDGEPLAEFFWRFARLSSTEQGQDPTAERIAHDSSYANLLKAKVLSMNKDDYRRGLLEATLDKKWPWWLLSFKDQETKNVRKFVVGKPNFTSPGVAGRGTRGFIALDLEKPMDSPVYLKDAWRVVHDDIEKEGNTLKRLNNVNASYVPTLEAHGDLDGQTTVSQDLWFKYRPSISPHTPCPLKKHTHYRIVVQEVGKPLTEIASGYDLINALYCCIRAHSDAYELGIIHRDISVGNILLYPSKDIAVQGQPQVFDGMLTDWELSKDVNSKSPVGRQPDRTGTWQFTSAQALRDCQKTIEIQDELESVFHVLLYIAIRFLPHNCGKDSVGFLLTSYFDDYKETNTGYGCGAAKLSSMRHGEITFDQDRDTIQLRFFYRAGSTKSHPINDIVDELLTWFKSHYTLTFRSRNPVKPDAGNESSRESSPTRSPRMPKKTWAATKRAKALGTPASTAKASKSTSKSSARENLEVDKENAAKLESHIAIAALFEEYLDESQHAWPRDDKVEDQRPKGGYKRGQDVLRGQTSYQNQPTSSLSIKRGVETVEAPEPPSTPKHRRIEG
ncbi:hypothetical protein C8Q79DRAFT_1104751 [Trametes meyenii]|nr:hypothetical protein C8Q79DRAFT_1104751 [Trametes meyenii]